MRHPYRTGRHWTTGGCFQLVVALLLTACGAPPASDQVADQFVQAYFVQNDMAGAVALASGQGRLVGGRFTVADLNVAAVVFYLRGAPEALAPWPRIASWYGAATERRAYKAMMALRGDA